MKKLIALLGAALMALGVQAAPAGHGAHAAKAPKLAQAQGKTALSAKGKTALTAKGPQARKADAAKAAKRKKATAHKPAGATKAASRKARNKRG